ncbi:ArsI/CadI family heavy metal resistance metalloenzyme [Solwaraspora sp. WMMD792]|uniref:ArsI/CadI family heavy metal resistance metalloenzyme n=1 Tax=Solwaraspora sp. WMMD792 TaxID=3016099 RepID=UPI00241778B0|nr:ArsI/CadI family heavy metal resistance metalloenzyme [Solwaraspora sp. WMMD792]MDG4771683.1 ArsI/CadI family heavy metal resistance metalloenzyme [Solwaraspora sp. WMMD792]
MKIEVFVSSDDDQLTAQQTLDAVPDVPDTVTLVATNLYGSTLDGVPAVVLQVMRIKRSGTMPLTVVDGKPVLSGELPTVDQLTGYITDGVEAAAGLVDRADSAVEFATASRMHISMFVNNLEESVKFYQVFFGQPPTKHLADYAKFEVAEPPLVISFNPDRKPASGGAVNHLGVQVKSTDIVMAMKERFAAAGFLTDEEVATPCCYAVQTKVWVGDPDGNRWEVYVVTEADADEGCGPDCACYAEIAPSRVSVGVSSKMPVSA